MNDEAVTYLTTILDSIEALELFRQGKALEDFSRERMFRSAVRYEFAVIGEAIGRLIRLEPDCEAAVTDARLIIALRNLLVHGYQYVVDTRIWEILQNDIALLRQEIETLMQQG